MTRFLPWAHNFWASFRFNFDLALILASTALTVLLAGIGVEMANNPPSTTKARKSYRVGFIVIGGLLIAVTWVQGSRNGSEQAKVVSDAASDRATLKSRYDELKGKLDNIGQVVEHPPAGLTQAQLADVVRKMLPPKQEQASASTNPPQPAPQPVPQVQVPLADQTKALKGITSAWTQSVNDWINTRNQEVPDEKFPQTSEDWKKSQEFHDKIEQEWSQKYQPMAGIFLGQYRQLHLVNGIVNACSGINLFGPGDHMQLATFKRCADEIQEGADKLK